MNIETNNDDYDGDKCGNETDGCYYDSAFRNSGSDSNHNETASLHNETESNDLFDD